MKQNVVVSVVRNLFLIVGKQKSAMSIFRDFILIVVRLKHCGERSQIFNFSGSEVKQRSEEMSEISF